MTAKFKIDDEFLVKMKIIRVDDGSILPYLCITDHESSTKRMWLPEETLKDAEQIAPKYEIHEQYWAQLDPRAPVLLWLYVGDDLFSSPRGAANYKTNEFHRIHPKKAVCPVNDNA